MKFFIQNPTIKKNVISIAFYFWQKLYSILGFWKPGRNKRKIKKTCQILRGFKENINKVSCQKYYIIAKTLKFISPYL